VSDPEPLYPVQREHLDELTDSVGIMQHAIGREADPAHGYCTDDVARQLSVDLLHGRVLGWPAVSESAARCLTFLEDAYDVSSGWFRNFRSAGQSGDWLDIPPSEDAHARALQALGEAIADGSDSRFRSGAESLFKRALPRAVRFRSIRPMAACILGCDAAIRGGVPGATAAYRTLVTALARTMEQHAATDAWPWPDTVLSYENALVPNALITAGRRLGDAELARLGVRTLDWLIEVQTAPDGHLTPIGNQGWWSRGGDRARFDQQPIEAATILHAAETAWRATGRDKYLTAAEAAYGWFLGRNDVGVPLAEPARGGCCDGLLETTVNPNQGAESTLMWLMALERIRGLREAAASSTPAHSAVTLRG
jgi:hypothetical protein